MMQDTALPLTVEEIYRDWPLSDDEIEAILDQSLAPRPATMLYDKILGLGLNETHRLLDMGCRDARHLCELVKRTGCTAVGIDPVDDHLVQARLALTAQRLTERVTTIKGRMETLPAVAEDFDYIWCRDVISHVANLRKGLGQCHRVLRAGGYMVIYSTFATPLLEPREAAQLYPPLAVNPANMSSAYLEEVVRRAGFTILEQDVIGSEWREAWEEDGNRRTSTQLLRLARLRRKRDEYIKLLGRIPYEVELANCYWGVYQMLGKLRPMVYVLQKP
ncbi:MAG: methyltransferase domain-containing protein [Caldilineaceae bacterium]